MRKSKKMGVFLVQEILATIPIKYLEQSNEIQSNWVGLENFDIYFWVLFESYCQSFISPPKCDIFVMFPNFLRSSV